MAETKNLLYKGKPLTRRGDDIYFGSFSDPYIIEMKILEKKTIGSLEVASKVRFALKDTARNLTIRELDRDGIYKAVDVAEFWLKEALGEL